MQSDADLRRAAALFSAGRLDEARDIGLALLAAQPADFYALHLLGAIAVRAGRLDEALQYTAKALAVRPDDPEVLCNHGIALRSLDRVEEALADYDRVIARHPDFPAVHGLRGVALAAQNRHAEAIASYSRALSLDPRSAGARFNRALSRLALGDFESAWPDFEARWGGSDTQIPLRSFGKPQWQGEDLTGKTLLVHAEQGLGDAIQFSRHIPAIAARAAHVVLEVQAPLKALLSSLPAQVVAMGEPLPAFDFHCPLLSLPLALMRCRARSTDGWGREPSRPYIHAPREHVAQWRDRLGACGQKRIGIAWSGSTSLRNDRNRSIPLARLQPLRNPSWELVSLQKEIRESDQASLRHEPPIRCFNDDILDFRDTAAIIENVDLVVSVDTAVAHLAGAMGKPVWILLPFSPDWRWQLDRDDSPWYPSARLFRQSRPGDWDAVIARVGHELQTLGV